MKLKSILLLLSSFFLSYTIHAQTTLSVGDIALIGIQADDEQFTFVTFVDLQAGTQIYFTDEEPSGTTIASGEGTILYTASSAVSAGTVIICSDVVNPSGDFAEVTNFPNFVLANGGDGVTMFQGFTDNGNGTGTATTFLHQIGEDAGDVGTPTGLTTNDQVLTGGDNANYSGSRTGTAAALYALIDDPSNYTTGSATADPALSTTSFTIQSGATTWNGTTWNNGVPDANTDAIIDGNTAPGSFTCKDLTINASRALIFGSGQVVTVSGTTVTNSGFGAIAADATGRLVFDNDGNTISLTGNAHTFRGVVEVSGTTTLSSGGLLTLSAPSTSSSGQLVGTGTVTGNVSLQAFLDASAGGRYIYIGSPLTNATLNDFNEPGAIMVSANTSQGTAWEWDAANAEWDPAGTAAGTGLAATATRGRGFAMYYGMNGAYGPFLIDDGDNTGTITITGAITNDDNLTSPLSYNNGQSSSVSFVGGTGVSATEGWNLVANPYAAIYDWDGQTIPTDMSSAIYRFNGTNYTSYVKGAGTGSRYIAPFQGFFVQLTANNPGNLTFNRSNRTESQSATLTKKPSYTIDGVYLHIEGLSGTVYDDVYAGFDANATMAFDKDWDARKLLNRGDAPNLYINLGSDAYSVCRVPQTGPWSFPMKLDYDQDGDNMTIDADLSQLQSFNQVMLEDRKLNIMHDFANGTYSFVQDNNFGPNRFILHFSQPSISIEEPTQKAMVYGYANDQGLHMELGILNNATVEVYNLAGQLLNRKEGQNGLVSFPVKDNGLYILKVEADNFRQSVKVIR